MTTVAGAAMATEIKTGMAAHPEAEKAAGQPEGMAAARRPEERTPDVSVIICTHNRAALLARTLKSLAEVEGVGGAEVIVVDNGSDDGTEQAVRACAAVLEGTVRIRYVREPRIGLSVARNTGIAVSRGPIVAFLDDDAVPSPGWLQSIRRAFGSYPRAGAVGGPVEPEFGVKRPEWLAGKLELPYTIIDLGPIVRRYPRRLHPFGANMAIRRDAIGDALRFPESLGRKGTALYSGEESWLFGRLRKLGWSLVYVPDMRVRHFIPAERLTPSWIRRRYYFQGLSMARSHTGVAGKIRIVSTIALRRLYIAFQSRFADTPAKRLWAECRLEAVRGALKGLAGGDARAG